MILSQFEIMSLVYVSCISSPQGEFSPFVTSRVKVQRSGPPHQHRPV